jgi:hypothetical protein
VVYRLAKILSVVALLAGGIGMGTALPVAAQQQPATAAATPTPAPTPAATPFKLPSLTGSDSKNVTAEGIAEWVIAIYGAGIGRSVLDQVRRNGTERGEIIRLGADGRTETSDYSWRFIRGASADKDRFRVDQKSPTLEYTLVFNAGQTWGIINGSVFVPRQEATDDFLNQQRRGLDTLLRYKENGSTVALLNREKQKGLDLYVVEVTDKEKRRTRFYVSAKTMRVLWLEYEEPGAGGTPVKFVKKFSDYRYAQNTLIPKHTVIFEDGKQTQEITIKTITYGVKLDDSLFQHPDKQATSANP